MKISFKLLLLFAIGTGFASCIGDDFVMDEQEPEVRITTLWDTLEVNTSIQFASTYFNNVGEEEALPIIWSSSDESIASITDDGLVTGLSEGDVIIKASVDDGENIISDSLALNIGLSTVISEVIRSGRVETTTFYDLTGAFELKENEDGSLNLSFDESYLTTSALPGLYIYLSNNKNSIADAVEISEVTTFAGAHEYTIENVGLMDFNAIVYFCKPFNVKVGDGDIN